MKAIRKSVRTGWLFILFAAVAFVVVNLVAIDATWANSTEEAGYITIIAGESKVITAPWPTIRVAVTDPKVANVQVLTPDQILLQGSKVGSTDLIMWNQDETQISQHKVYVSLDVARHQIKLRELFPYSSLEVDQSGEVLIVKGLLRNADHAVQLHDYLEKIGVKYVDMTSVAGVQQVQLQVRVAEVSRAAIRIMGISAFHTGEGDYFAGIRPGSASGGALMPSISIGPEAGAAAAENLSFVFQQDVVPGPLVTVFAGFPALDMEVFIQALSENQYLRLLANPTLVALSGEEANFLAGGEFPIPVVQGSGGGAGGGTAVTIEYREYGVRLSFRPTVLGDGTIRLYAAPEVSALTSVGAVVVQGFEVPALTTRKFETTLELKSGQTFAMAGLINRSSDAIKSRIPGVGDLPILGPLFRSVRYSKNETELIVLVTASLVEPMSLGTTPPLPGFLHTAPNDWEFYLDGRIEGKEPARINPADAEWLREMGLDRLFGPGAWDTYDSGISPSRAKISPEEQ